MWAYRRQGQAAVDADDAMQPLGRGLWDLVYESRRLQPEQQQPEQQAVGEAKLCEADEGVVRAAANAISVLVCAGVSMAGKFVFGRASFAECAVFVDGLAQGET